jgi:hypothetical protein
MNTNEPKSPLEGQFTEAEVASVTTPPEGDPELDEVDAAQIDAEEVDVESSFE